MCYDWKTNSPILEHFCILVSFCPLPTQCPDGVSICPAYHPQPLFITQPSHTSYVHTQNTPTPSQNTPFPGLNLKLGKMTYHLSTWTPTGQYVWKMDKTFLEVSKKKYSLVCAVCSQSPDTDDAVSPDETDDPPTCQKTIHLVRPRCKRAYCGK